jgi:molecular chaperone DnaJ
LLDPRTRAEVDRRHPYAPPPDAGEASLFQEAGRRWAANGQDVVAVAHLDLVTSIDGGPVAVTVRGPVSCVPCEGTGFDREGAAVTCWTCEGTGQVTFTNRFGESTGTCLTCGGEKSQPAQRCVACEGRGTVMGERVVSVDIPAGTGDGDTITVAGLGGPSGRGGTPGDLLVVVALDPHPVFSRAGLDLTIVIPVSFAEAVQGAELAIPTFDGPLGIALPAGTQGGTVFAVRGRGVRSGDDVGDLLVTVHITVPTDVSAEVVGRLSELPDGGASELRSMLFDAMDTD